MTTVIYKSKKNISSDAFAMSDLFIILTLLSYLLFVEFNGFVLSISIALLIPLFYFLHYHTVLIINDEGLILKTLGLKRKFIGWADIEKAEVIYFHDEVYGVQLISKYKKQITVSNDHFDKDDFFEILRVIKTKSTNATVCNRLNKLIEENS